MKIPKSFKQFGQTITVEYSPEVLYNEDVTGWAKYRQNKIVLQSPTNSTPITEEMLEQNFCHELMHFILYGAGEDCFNPPLHKREYLVDRMAGLLHQFLTTTEHGNSYLDYLRKVEKVSEYADKSTLHFGGK